MADESPDTDAVTPGRALFRLVRYWSRRWTGAGQGIDADRGRDVMVTEAVAALADEGGATVNQVAEQLGVDQSGASRMISQAVGRGYLTKVASPLDGRARRVAVSEDGAHMLAAAHRWQESVFAELTADWDADDVERFHGYLLRLLEGQAARRE